MCRNLRLRLAQVILILALLGGLSASRAYCYETSSISGRWISFNRLVDVEVDSMMSPDGRSSIRFTVKNHTGQMNFGYVFEETTNLSNGTFLVFWIRIQNIAEKHSYFLVLDDEEGRRRAFWDLVRWFDLQPMRWARLAVDPTTVWWEDDDFDPTRVTRARFTFHGGSRYSQVVWLADLIVFEPDTPVNQEKEEDRNPLLIWGILLTVSLALIAGFVTLGLIGFPVHSRANPIIMAPIYFMFGLSSIALVFRFLALFHIDVFMVTGYIVLLAVIFALLSRKKIRKYLGSLSFRSCKDVSVVLPIILLGFSFLRFTDLTLGTGWAPLFDSMTHGKLISLIVHHNRIPSSTYPVGNLSLGGLLGYPLGFHIVGALISIITDLYPGEAILVILTSIMVFLPSLLFSTIYIGTGSLELSFVAYLFAYFLPGGDPVLWRPSHDLLLGNFLTGTHPNLFGNAVFLTFFPVMLGLDQTEENGVKRFMAYAMLMVALAVIYYPLLPYALLFCLLAILKNRLTRSRMTPFGIAEILLVCIIIVASYLCANWIIPDALNVNKSELEIHFAQYMKYSLFAPISPYFVYTVSLCSALSLSLYLFLDRKNVKPAIMFWALFFPLMISQNQPIFIDFLWFTQPDRVLILLVVSSHIVILLGASKLFEHKVRNSLVFHIAESRVLFNAIRVQTFLIILLLFAPIIVAHLSYSYPANLQAELPHGNDLAAMKWLSENADSEDLILNFPMSTAWLPSLRAINVVNDHAILIKLYFGSINGTWLANRTIESNQMISHPWDSELTRELAYRYGLKYVYIGEGDPEAAIRVGGQRIAPLPGPILLSREQRLTMYMLNPYLEVAYRAGNAVVFRVKSE